MGLRKEEKQESKLGRKKQRKRGEWKRKRTGKKRGRIEERCAYGDKGKRETS